MTHPTSRVPLAVRSELFVRVLGWWISAIALVGAIAAVVGSDPTTAAWVVVFWAAPGLWWGWRVSHLGVFEEPDALVVRNPFRTYRIPWSAIVDITTKTRHSPHRVVAPVAALFNRTVGVIEVRNQDKVIEMQTTESLWPVTRMLRRSPDQSAANIKMIRSTWRDRQAGQSGDP